MAMSPERKAERAASRKREKHLNSLTSVAHLCKVEGERDQIEAVINNCVISGSVAEVNQLLEKMGYRPVRITSNMLNPKAGRFCIDINTPNYCDVGSEAYWSM